MALSSTFWVIVLSELVALWIIWRLWRSADHLFFKITLSLVAIVPLLGPLLALWIANFPPRAPRILRDQKRFQRDVHDRWKSAIDAPNPQLRFSRWRELMTKHRNEDP